jgi:hypothetical protein
MTLVPILAGLFSLIHLSQMQNSSTQTLKKQALAELKAVLEHRQKFIKAHAAEYLIWTGNSGIALKEFLKEERLHGAESKCRVVIWRILVQAETDPLRKKLWLEKIYGAYKDMDGPDRVHATETLAKLKQPVADLFPQVTTTTLASEDTNLNTYALWASSYGSSTRMNKNRQRFLQMALTDTSILVRKISAYVLRKEQGLAMQQWDKLYTAALAANKTSDIYITLLTTALVTAPAKADCGKLAKIDELLTADIGDYNVGERTELAQALAEKGTKKHLALLMNLMDSKYSAGVYDPAGDEGADLRAAAAYAILRINSR